MVKKLFAILACVAIGMALFVGCSNATTKPAAKGDTLAGDKLSITKLSGWEQMAVPGGFQIYKASGEILQIQVLGNNVSEAEDKAVLESLSKANNGSALEQVDLLGLKFYKTFYTANGKEQVFYSTVRNGEQVKLQATGQSYDSNPDIKVMVESIQLK